LRAIALVEKAHPTAVFRVYGDGELRDELMAQARELGLAGEEILVGPSTREDLKEILSRTTVWVSSSIFEGQSVALVEAMAHGRAIVTTQVGGSVELITHGVNGLLCPAADPESLARNICLLLESEELRSRLGAAARRSYEAGSHQADTVSAYVKDIYQEVVRGEAGVEAVDSEPDRRVRS
jgi:glycosyltransferase involved in cell wall biosynthesis